MKKRRLLRRPGDKTRRALTKIQRDAVKEARKFLAEHGDTPTYTRLGELLGVSQGNAMGRMLDAFAKQELSDIRPYYAARAQKPLPHPSRKYRNEPPDYDDIVAIGTQPTFSAILRAIINLGGYSHKDLNRMVGFESGSFSRIIHSDERLYLHNADAVLRVFWPHGVRLALPCETDNNQEVLDPVLDRERTYTSITEALRDSVKRCGRSRLSIAQEIGVSPNQLYGFASGRLTLTAATLNRLAETVWPHGFSVRPLSSQEAGDPDQ